MHCVFVGWFGLFWFGVKAKVYGPGGRRVRNPKPDCYYTSVVALTYSPYIIVNTV